MGKCQKEIHQNVSYFWVMESLVIFNSSSYFSSFSIMLECTYIIYIILSVVGFF